MLARDVGTSSLLGAVASSGVVELMLDSGAELHVAPSWLAAGLPMVSSRPELHLCAVDRRAIAHQGQVDVPMVLGQGGSSMARMLSSPLSSAMCPGLFFLLLVSRRVG